MRYWRILCVLVGLLSCASLTWASPFNLSGEWELNANGMVYKMVLLEKGEQLEGVLYPINHQSSNTQLAGRVFYDGKIELYCNNSGKTQQYMGYIFQGVDRNNGMAGLFTLGAQQFGWFAERWAQPNPSPYISSTPYIPQPTYPTIRSQKMFSSASTSLSNNQKEPRLEVDTIFNKTPDHITTPFNGQVTINPGQKLLLAGNPAGTDKWQVGGFLFLEFRFGYAVKRFVVASGLDKIRCEGQAVEKIGSGGSYHAPDEFDFAPYLPQNLPIDITAYALHYGPGIGSVSDVYLIVK